jgi:hypothetical protein
MKMRPVAALALMLAVCAAAAQPPAGVPARDIQVKLQSGAVTLSGVLSFELVDAWLQTHARPNH